MKKTKTDSIGYAFYAFGGLGLEAVLLMVETNLYGQTSGAWSMMKQLAHWIIISFIWGGVGMFFSKTIACPSPKRNQKQKLHTGPYHRFCIHHLYDHFLGRLQANHRMVQSWRRQVFHPVHLLRL
ncbi:hypothetical protein IMSAGC018_00622 [Lachnospiraceae bacterium]|nr:hypothetical protein IMSAGC018_00622 [Lachnospiraceae bacterium]